MRIKIFLNRTYKKSCNLIVLELDARSFSIDVNSDGNKYITISGITFADTNSIINSIEFIYYGYTSKIAINSNGSIYSTTIEYTKKLYLNDLEKCVNFIKKIEEEE